MNISVSYKYLLKLIQISIFKTSKLFISKYLWDEVGKPAVSGYWNAPAMISYFLIIIIIIIISRVDTASLDKNVVRVNMDAVSYWE